MIKNNKIFERQNIRHFISESWSNSWPMILIMFFEFLIGLTDIFIAGRVGKEIQATYGFVIQLYFVFVIIANAITTGTVSVVSRLFTAGDKISLITIYSTVATVVSGILFVASISTPPINFINIPEELNRSFSPLENIRSGLLLLYSDQYKRHTRACKRPRVAENHVGCVCPQQCLNFFLVLHTAIGYKACLDGDQRSHQLRITSGT
jgi:hypothetical protein